MSDQPERVIVGVDPGLPLTIGVISLTSGKPLRFYENDEVATSHKVANQKKERWFNNAQLVSYCFESIDEDYTIDHVVIEKVGPMPGEKLATACLFVGSMFLAQGVCAGMGLDYVMAIPTTWKRQLNLRGNGEDMKEISRRRALELWPTKASWFTRKMDHNRAEAFLLAEWKRSQLV